jgi:hypothetical protein
MAVYFNKEEELEHRIELLEIAMGNVQLAMRESNNKEKATLPINSVMPCAYLVQSKKDLLIHGLFSTYEKAEKYINGSPNMAIQKVDIA